MSGKIRYFILPLILIAATFIWWGMRNRPAPTAAEANASAAANARTKSGGRDEADPERDRRRREAIAAAVARWHEELLEKYPQMRPEYHDVPDAENGYLQYLLLVDRTGERQLSQELYDMCQDAAAWDSAAFRRWLDEHQTYFQEIQRIAELPRRSTKGIGPDRLFGNGARFSGEFGAVLVGAARLAFERGDHEAVLRLMTNALALGDHISGVEAPTALGRVIGAGYDATVWGTYRDVFLPAIAGDDALLRRWQAILEPRESAAEGYARTMVGEWNAILQMHLLPGLLGGQGLVSGFEAQLPPVEEFAPVFLAMQKAAAEGVLRHGADRFDPEGAEQKIPPGQHGEKTLALLNHVTTSMRRLAEAFGVVQTRQAMDRAAIAILLGEEPPVDPVSGEAFVWDAETRMLSAPGDTGAVDPIRLP